jgi:hypothetical protein
LTACGGDQKSRPVFELVVAEEPFLKLGNISWQNKA